MIGVVADRFGKDIFVREESEEAFVVDIKVALSPQFFGWVFGLSGKVQILSPMPSEERFAHWRLRISVFVRSLPLCQAAPVC